MTEELWEKLGRKELLAKQAWPVYEEKYLKDATVEYALQINGKVKATFNSEADAAEDGVKASALELAKTKGLLNGHQVLKVIVVKNRLVNIVVKTG
jgi:leucyl-tRNA synthetase